jgi:hypothetical protein
MVEQGNDATREQVYYVKNPFDLLFEFVKHGSKRRITQVEFSAELHKRAEGLKRRRPSAEDKRRPTAAKTGSKRVGYSTGQVNQRLKVDYFKRGQNDAREPGNLLTLEDEYVLNAQLKRDSGGAFTNIFDQRAAIEEEIGYRLPRESEDNQSVLERKLSNLRGVWQFLHVSLTKSDMERVRYGEEGDSGRYKIRDGIAIFFGFGSDRIKTLLLGTGRAWAGEASIPGSKIYVQLRIPRTNEQGHLVLHDPGWLGAPLEGSGRPAIIDGVRSGTVSDNNYSGGMPIVACRCVLRKLHHASQEFLANDAIIDASSIARYKALCRYETLAVLRQASKGRADFLAPNDPENFTAERDYDLNVLLDKLMNSSGKLDFPIMRFHHD